MTETITPPRIKSTELYGTPTASQLLGISTDQFRRLVEKLSYEPADWRTNPHYRSGPMCPLWAGRDLSRLRRTKLYRETLLRNQRRSQPPAYKPPNFADDSEAAKAAADALFNLNRYAKHNNCTRQNRSDIYALKSKAIEKFTGLQLCTGVSHFDIHRPAKLCFGCEGTGTHWSGDACNRCDGTGIYLEETTDRFYILRFLVCEQRYCWHQPADCISPELMSRLKPQSELVDDEWDGRVEVKPVYLSPHERTKAKKLLTWYTATTS